MLSLGTIPSQNPNVYHKETVCFYPQCWTAIAAATSCGKSSFIFGALDYVGLAHPCVLVMYKHFKLFGKLAKMSDGHLHMNVHMLNGPISICIA